MSGRRSVDLGEIITVAPSDAWPGEVEFSSWLADNLGHLSAAIGVGDLERIGVEQPVGDFRCDIVAQEVGSGRIVVVENQFTRTDHDHLGKLLTYAARYSASIVIWISKDVRDEHRAAIDWLNKSTGDGLGFFAVRLRVIKIDNSRPAPTWDLVAFPNSWTPPVGSTVQNSPRSEEYRRFFQSLIDELREKHRFTAARIGQPQSWYAFATGTSGFRFSAVFASGGRVRAELYIDTGSQMQNKVAFDYLTEKRPEIEREFGYSLEWDRMDGRQACRISVSRSDVNIDMPADRREELKGWLVERLLIFKKVFGPLLRDALSAAESAIEEDESLTLGQQ